MEKTLQNYLYTLELHEEVQNAEMADFEVDMFDGYQESVEFLKNTGITEEELELDW